MSKHLTFEEAKTLRRQVTEKDIKNLDIWIVSGGTEFGATLTGKKVFATVLRGRMWAQSRSWFWKYQPDVSPSGREGLADIPGISDGDEVTLGQLAHLGVKLQSANAGDSQVPKKPEESAKP